MTTIIQRKIQPVTQRFRLDETTKQELKSMTPKFGFNGLGEVVFRRTYSRDNEDWADVVTRVTEGAISLRKEHFFRNTLDWCDDSWQSFARDFAVSLFKMEWMPPGRGLWMMGTEFTYERGAMALNNCAATDVKEDVVLSAEWTMDLLMNGCGVGFTTNWRGEATAPDKKDSEIFVIPDSREGWCESMVRLMCAYIESPRYGKNKFPIFDYDTIRKAGEPIKGFGGTASGPAPLKKMHNRIESYLDAISCGRLVATSKTWKEFKTDDGKSEWKEVEIEVDRVYSHTRFVADVFNAIGACVVAGNVRRCLPGGSMVHTKEGLVPIEDIKIGDEVMTMEGYEKVTNTFEQGEQKLVRINTQDGYFRCTPNHLMAVCTSYDTYDWKQASELKAGDRLISSRFQIDGQDTNLPEWKYDKPDGSTTCKDITIPPLDEDMAWLIGLFQGDGYTYANRKKNGFNAYISIVGGLNEYDAMEKAQQQLQRFGKDLHVTLKKRKGENSYIVHCQSKQLAWYLDEFVKKPNTTIRTPEYILLAKPSIKLAYVSGITDADGCLKNRPVQVMTTVYKEFAIDVQNILYSCGIESRYVECSTDWESREGWQQLFLVNLITKKSQEDFDSIPQLHKEMRKSSRSHNANGFPTSFEQVPRIKSKFGLYANKQFNIDAYTRQYGECNYCPVEVVEVVEDKSELTYDIEVNRRHEFFCNGLLTHNSAEICLGDVEDKDFINLKNYEMFPERSETGWMSNNSVVLTANADYEDFSYIPDLARRIRDNGEPGVINLYNIQKYGRFGKELHDDATLVNPCAEISLSSMETCNLAEAFPPRCKDENVFYQALKYATFYTSSVSLLPTHRAETNAIVAKNRRVGVSISGIAQWASGEVPEGWGEMNYTKMSRFLRNGYQVVRAENTRLANAAGVPASIRVTTVKPSGSISLLAGVTPGVHYPVSRYVIRRMRIGKDSPLVPFLKEAKIPWEEDHVSDGTLVFEFTVDHGNVRPCEEVSPWEQFSLVQMLQKHYSDNSVSATIYFDKVKDGPDIEKMLAMFIPNLKTVSMLPHAGHGYDQAPYEPITEEQYNERRNAYTIPNFKSVRGNVPIGSKYCTGDKCMLPARKAKGK